MANNKLFDRVKMTVSGTPGTGSVTLNVAATGYRSFASAGVANGDTVSYLIEDGSSWEFGVGTYTSSTTVMSRDTVTASSAGGTTKISATSSAVVYITARSADLVQFDSAGNVNLTNALNEKKTAPSISSGTLTLDCSAGNVFAVSLNANITTLTFSNVPASGTAYGLTLAFTADGTARTVTWGSAVKWPGGTAPTLTSTNAKVDIFVLTTWDGGTTWYGFTSGQNA